MATKKKATAKRKKPGPKRGTGGRPRVEFDLTQIEGLGSIMATHEEIASVMGCSVSTVQDRMKGDEDFSMAYKKGQAGGKLSLRRAQQQAVGRGNITMMIWLGKQWLGQKDQVTVDATVEERTGVAHVPPEVTLEHWQKEYGVIEHNVDADKEEPN